MLVATPAFSSTLAAGLGYSTEFLAVTQVTGSFKARGALNKVCSAASLSGEHWLLSLTSLLCQ